MIKRSFAIILLALLIIGPQSLWASNSLSYSGRLVNADGSPVTNSVNLKFELAYTTPGGVGPALCSQQLTNVHLSNGVFHVKLDPDCSPLNLTTFFAQTPAGESVAIRVTDEGANKTYSYQALYSIPFAHVSKQLSQMGANTNDILQWDGSKWNPAALGSIAGVGTVTQIDTGAGLTGGPITATGTISITNSGVNTIQLADGAVTDLKVAAGIARSKLAIGTPNYVLMNNGSGGISEVAQLPLAQGGTGAANAAEARTNLGLGVAAVLNTGMGSTNVLIGGDVQSCFAHQKLQWNLAPVMGWSCVNDNDSLDTTKLPLAGGTMTGAIDMGSNAIINLPAPTNATDAANMAYVDAQVGAVNSSQWITTGSDIYYDAGKVGIGTTAPETILTIDTSGTGFTKHYLRNRTSSTGLTWEDMPGISLLKNHSDDSSVNSATLNNETYGEIAFGGVNTSGEAFHSASIIVTQAGAASASGPNGAKLRFGTANGDGSGLTTRMTIDNLGNVGIGTTSPTQKLDVAGNVAVSGILKLKSDTANYVELQAPLSLAETLTLIFPGNKGTAGQALITDGNGNLSWSSVATSASTVSGDLNGTITNAQINLEAVGSAEIADLSVSDGDIANNTISYGKLNLADASIPQVKVNGLTTALSGKEPTITAGDSTQYWRGDKTWQTLNTTAVPEGTNLYFLESRVRSALMIGYTAGSALSLSPTDSLLQALGKLEGQIIANKAAFDGTGQWSKNGSSVYYNSGNVGVGTINPSSKLEISGTEGVDESRLTFSASDSSDRFTVETDLDSATGNDLLGFRSTTTDNILVLKGNGNVGVGTTSPTAAVQVGGGAAAGDILLMAGSALPNDAGDLIFKNNSDTQLGRVWTDTISGGLILTGRTSNAVDMYLNPAGNVGIGTTNPLAKLDVNGVIAVGGKPTIQWQEIADPIIHEFSLVNSTPVNIAVPGIPAGSRYLLVDVFITCSATDHFNLMMGRGANAVQVWVNARGDRPSTVFGALAKHSIKLNYSGDSDGFSSNYGRWYSSQVMPINANTSFDASAAGHNGASTVWVYMVIRGYSY